MVEVALLKCPSQALVGWLSEVIVMWFPTAPVIVTVPAKVYFGVVPPASLANFNVLPAVVSVTLLNVVDDDPPMVVIPELLNTTVLVPWVNVPLFVNAEPVTVMVEALAVRAPLEVMLIEPAVREKLEPEVSKVSAFVDPALPMVRVFSITEAPLRLIAVPTLKSERVPKPKL